MYAFLGKLRLDSVFSSLTLLLLIAVEGDERQSSDFLSLSLLSFFVVLTGNREELTI